MSTPADRCVNHPDRPADGDDLLYCAECYGDVLDAVDEAEWESLKDNDDD